MLFLSFSTVPFASNDLLYYRTARRAIDCGHDVFVSPYDWAQDAAPEYRDIERAGARLLPRPRWVREDQFLARQIGKLRHRLERPEKGFAFISEVRPHVIVASDPGTFHMLTAPGFASALLHARVPFVTISQYNDELAVLRSDLRAVAQRVFDAAAACVFVSARNLEVARRQLCLPLSHAVVMDNPPDLADWQCRPWPATTTPRRLACVARLESHKGQSILLEILRGSHWLERDWGLTLYGSGADEQYLRDLVRFFGLQDRVRLAGQVSDVGRVWETNELLVLCSSGEGKPLALTEAMLCGRPSVVTDVGGNAELVEDGVTGFVAQSATVKSFDTALQRAWERRAEWRVMGQRAHDLMAQRLDPPPDARLLTLLETVAGLRAAPTSHGESLGSPLAS